MAALTRIRGYLVGKYIYETKETDEAGDGTRRFYFTRFDEARDALERVPHGSVETLQVVERDGVRVPAFAEVLLTRRDGTTEEDGLLEVDPDGRHARLGEIPF